MKHFDTIYNFRDYLVNSLKEYFKTDTKDNGSWENSYDLKKNRLVLLYFLSPASIIRHV